MYVYRHLKWLRGQLKSHSLGDDYVEFTLGHHIPSTVAAREKMIARLDTRYKAAMAQLHKNMAENIEYAIRVCHCLISDIDEVHAVDINHNQNKCQSS